MEIEFQSIADKENKKRDNDLVNFSEREFLGGRPQKNSGKVKNMHICYDGKIEDLRKFLEKEKNIVNYIEIRGNFYITHKTKGVSIVINNCEIENGNWCIIKENDFLNIYWNGKNISGEIKGNIDKKNNKYIESDLRLPFCEPRIKTYPYFTDIVGTLDAYNVADNWIYNNFLLIWIFGKAQNIDYWADFKFGNEKNQIEFCKQLKKEIITRKKIARKYDSIVCFVIETLNNKKYLFMSVDTYYIKEWWENNSNRLHYRHQVYVYGYNNKEKYIILSDFVNGEYKTLKVSYSSFEQAYNGYEKAPIIHNKYGENNWIISYDNKEIEQIDIKRIKGLIENFVQSMDTYVKSYLWKIKNKCDLKYGLKYYDELINVLKKNKYSQIDYRVIHILVVLNDVMLDRLIYLEEKGYLKCMEECIANAESLSKNTRKLQNMALRYNVTNKNEYYERIISEIKKLKIEQQYVFSLCLYYMEEQ